MRDKKELPIIFLPQLEPRGQRTLEGTLKFVLTVLLLLILVVLTLVLWFGAAVYLPEQILADNYIKKSWGMLFTVGWVALGAFLLMLFWHQYNLRVFGKRTRRQFPPPVGPADVAKMLELPEETVIHAQNLSMGTLHVKDGKRILCAGDEEIACVSLDALDAVHNEKKSGE